MTTCPICAPKKKIEKLEYMSKTLNDLPVIIDKINELIDNLNAGS